MTKTSAKKSSATPKKRKYVKSGKYAKSKVAKTKSKRKGKKKMGRPANPFQIEQVTLTTTKGNQDVRLLDNFLSVVKKLPIDKKSSTFISRDVAATKKDGTNFYLNAKRALVKEGEYAMTSREVKDEKGNYQGIRVWRIN